jgi:hypothetical protein
MMRGVVDRRQWCSSLKEEGGWPECAGGEGERRYLEASSSQNTLCLSLPFPAPLYPSSSPLTALVILTSMPLDPSPPRLS